MGREGRIRADLRSPVATPALVRDRRHHVRHSADRGGGTIGHATIALGGRPNRGWSSATSPSPASATIASPCQLLHGVVARGAIGTVDAMGCQGDLDERGGGHQRQPRRDRSARHSLRQNHTSFRAADCRLVPRRARYHRPRQQPTEAHGGEGCSRAEPAWCPNTRRRASAPSPYGQISPAVAGAAARRHRQLLLELAVGGIRPSSCSLFAP